MYVPTYLPMYHVCMCVSMCFVISPRNYLDWSEGARGELGELEVGIGFSMHV